MEIKYVVVDLSWIVTADNSAARFDYLTTEDHEVWYLGEYKHNFNTEGAAEAAIKEYFYKHVGPSSAELAIIKVYTK